MNQNTKEMFFFLKSLLTLVGLINILRSTSEALINE